MPGAEGVEAVDGVAAAVLEEVGSARIAEGVAAEEAAEVGVVEARAAENEAARRGVAAERLYRIAWITRGARLPSGCRQPVRE